MKQWISSFFGMEHATIPTTSNSRVSQIEHPPLQYYTSLGNAGLLSYRQVSFELHKSVILIGSASAQQHHPSYHPYMYPPPALPYAAGYHQQQVLAPAVMMPHPVYYPSSSQVVLPWFGSVWFFSQNFECQTEPWSCSEMMREPWTEHSERVRNGQVHVQNWFKPLNQLIITRECHF